MFTETFFFLLMKGCGCYFHATSNMLVMLIFVSFKMATLTFLISSFM